MIIRKTIATMGHNGGVWLPKANIGKECWVVLDDDIDDLKELIMTTLLYRKAYKHDQDILLKELKEFRILVEARLERIERVTGLGH